MPDKLIGNCPVSHQKERGRGVFQNGEVPIVLEETDETLSRTGLNPSFAAIADPACAFNDQLGIMGMGKDSDAWLDDFHLKSPGKRMRPEET